MPTAFSIMEALSPDMTYVSLKAVTQWLNYLPGWIAHYILEDTSIGF